MHIVKIMFLNWESFIFICLCFIVYGVTIFQIVLHRLFQNECIVRQYYYFTCSEVLSNQSASPSSSPSVENRPDQI